jgi:hypothetical protein
VAPNGATAEFVIDVETDDGVPYPTGSISLKLSPDFPKMTPHDLDNLRLGRAFNGIVRDEAVRSTTERRLTPEEMKTLPAHEIFERVERREADAYHAAKGAQRRRPVTPQVLAKVLALYDKGGIEAVVAGTNYSEPYCWKLLRRARQELSS